MDWQQAGWDDAKRAYIDAQTARVMPIMPNQIAQIQYQLPNKCLVVGVKC